MIPENNESVGTVYPKHLLLSALLAFAVFVIDLQIPLGVAGGVPYIAVILVALWSPNPRCVVGFAIVCTILTILGYYLSPEGGELWKVIFNRALAIFAIWITAILALKRKKSEQETLNVMKETEKEKEKIYQATLHGAQHVTYNLLQGLKLVEMEIDKHPDFDRETVKMFDDMLVEAKFLMEKLSTVRQIDENVIRNSIDPK